MEDFSLIKRETIDVKPSEYISIFRKFGHITFEVNDDENTELIRLANDFKEIEKQPVGFDKEKWINDNMDFDVSPNAFAVFSFLITCWNPTTIISNAESPNTGLIYVCVKNENATH